MARFRWGKYVRGTAVAAALLVSSGANATDWYGYLVGRVMTPDSSRDCIFFELVGVAVADAAVSAGGPWMAFPRSQNGFGEMYSLLLYAKSTGLQISVTTNGLPAAGGCSANGNIVGVTRMYLYN